MVNQYLDDLKAAGGVCMNCPIDTFSPPGSIGSASCKKRKPCAEDDYTFTYSDCDIKTNTRHKAAVWTKNPMICDNSNSILPSDTTVPCRGCGRGEYRNPETDQCIWCETGYF